MAKINFQELVTKSTVMIEELVVYHTQVVEAIKAEKSRPLATVESALRNAVDHLDRLPEAVKKVGTTTGKVQKRTSRLSKPTAAAK